MRNIFMLSCLLMACAPSTERVAQPVIDVCTVTAAVPDDDLDDRVAIQSALNNSGCAYLPSGVYDIDTPIAVAPARRPYGMLTLTDGRMLYGDGDTTVIRFRGDARGQDWYGVLVLGDDTTVNNLAFDSAQLVGTSEQTHAIRVTGPLTNTELHSLEFNHPVRANGETTWSGGDCIQFVGYELTPINNARVHHSSFTHCDRSGVAWHSGMHDFEITDNTFPDTGDQDLDGEGTGDNDGILIARNVFGLSPLTTVNMAIQIQLAENVRITENVFDARGLFLYGCSYCEIDSNSLIRSVSGVEAAIFVSKASSYVNVHHNTIERHSSAGAGSLIRATPHGTGTPDHLTVSDNELRQYTTGHVVESVGLVGLYVERNVSTYTGGTGFSFVLANGSTTIRTDDIVITGNVITGPSLAALSLSGSYAGVGSFTATGNVTADVQHGVRCSNVNSGAKVLGPATVSGNDWGASICGTLIGAGQ